MLRSSRQVVALLAAVAALGLGGCGARSPLDGGGGAEDRALIAIGEAFAAEDCAAVEQQAIGFATSDVARFDAVTTWLGRCYYRDGDFALATETLGPPSERDPAGRHTADALYFLGRAWYRLHDPGTAVSVFAALPERFPHSARGDDSTYWGGRSLLLLLRPVEALAAFHAVLVDPGASESRRARATYHSGRAEVERAEAAGPGSTRWGAATAWFDEVLGTYAASLVADDAACELARVPYRRGRWAEAEQALAAFLEDWPAAGVRYRADWFRARAVEAQGDLARAVTLYASHEVAYQDHSYSDDARYRKGRTLYLIAKSSGDYGAAEDVLGAFLADWPASTLRPSGSYYLGRSIYEQGRFEEAVVALAEAVAATTSVYNDNALYYTGRSWYRLAWRGQTARYEDAVAAFDVLAARWPESSYADDGAYFRARSLVALGRLSEAQGALEDLVAVFPGSSYLDNALYWLVRVRLSLGDCAGAAAALAALELTDSTYIPKARTRFESSACAEVAP